MITQKLVILAETIAKIEGWDPLKGGGVNKDQPTVAYRNHNPGNLRKSPFAVSERDGFAVFLNDQAGFFAIVWDLWSKTNGKTSTGLTSNSTIADLINVWAPPSENNTEKYILDVEKYSGFSRGTVLGSLIQ